LIVKSSLKRLMTIDTVFLQIRLPRDFDEIPLWVFLKNFDYGFSYFHLPFCNWEQSDYETNCFNRFLHLLQSLLN